jgi:hypothetical protein
MKMKFVEQGVNVWPRLNFLFSGSVNVVHVALKGIPWQAEQESTFKIRLMQI